MAYDAPGERWVLKLVVGYDRGVRYDALGERSPCESECANDGIGPRTGMREACPASEVVLLLADVMSSVDVEVRRDEPSAETSASAPDVSPSSSSSTDWSEEVDGRRSPSSALARALPLSWLGLPRLGSMLGRVLRRLSTSSHSLSENAWSSDGNHDPSTLVSVPTSRRSSTATQSSQFSRRGCRADALRLSGRVDGP